MLTQPSQPSQPGQPGQGPTTAFQAAVPLDAGEYTCAVDGFAIGVVSWPDSPSPGCSCWIAGSTNGIWMVATGGNAGLFGPGWKECQASNGNSFTLPVPANQKFQLTVTQMQGEGQETDAPYNFYWVGMGSGTPTPTSYYPSNPFPTQPGSLVN